MTDTEVRALAELERKATAGPWEADSVMSEAMHDIVLGYLIPGQGNPIVVASFYGGERPINSVQAEINTKLACAARNAIPSLISDRERLLAELAATAKEMLVYTGGIMTGMRMDHNSAMRAAERSLALVAEMRGRKEMT